MLPLATALAKTGTTTLIAHHLVTTLGRLGPTGMLAVVFLVTAIATSVTGFLFPYTGFLPSHGVGVLSLIALAAAVAALYAFGLTGAWRRIYVVGIVVADAEIRHLAEPWLQDLDDMLAGRRQTLH